MTQNNSIEARNPQDILSKDKPQPCCALCGKHKSDLTDRKRRIIASPRHFFILRDHFYQNGHFRKGETVLNHHIENQEQLLAALPLIQQQLETGVTVQINQLFSNDVCAIKFTNEQNLNLTASLLRWIEAKDASYPWLCTECSGYTCRSCGNELTYTPAADSFNDKDKIVHSATFPVLPYCNSACRDTLN